MKTMRIVAKSVNHNFISNMQAIDFETIMSASYVHDTRGLDSLQFRRFKSFAYLDR